MESTFTDKSPNRLYQWGLIYGILGIFVLVAGRIVLWLKPPIPKCMFKEITGYPCMTCGATRCIEEFSQFHFWNAFLMNPLIFLMGAGFGLFFLYSAGVYLFNLPKIQFTFVSKNAKLVRILIVLAVLINWIYLIKVG